MGFSSLIKLAAAGRNVVGIVVAYAGADAPGNFAVVGDFASVGLVGDQSAGGYGNRVDQFFVGVEDTNPVGAVGVKGKVCVERTACGLAVGPKDDVLAFSNFGAHVAQGYGVHRGVVGVVREVDGRYINGAEVRVEEFDPGHVFAVVVDDVGFVDNHHLVDFDGFAVLGK